MWLLMETSVSVVLVGGDDEVQLGRLNRKLGSSPCFLPADGDMVDVFDEEPENPGDGDAPNDSSGGWPNARCDGRNWSADLNDVQVSLVLEVENQGYADSVSTWLSHHGWEDWWHQAQS